MVVNGGQGDGKGREKGFLRGGQEVEGRKKQNKRRKNEGKKENGVKY